MPPVPIRVLGLSPQTNKTTNGTVKHMEYNDFVELASKNQLSEVTQDEFDAVVTKFPRLHTAAWIRYIKSTRRTKGGAGSQTTDKTGWERKGPEIAYVLGGRDFTPGIPINDSWAQWLTCFSSADGLFQVLNRASFGGQHGRKHELHLERENADKSWTVTAWGDAEKEGKPNPVLTLTDGIKLDMLPWKDVNEFSSFTKDEHDRPLACVMGKIVYVTGMPDRQKPKVPVEGKDFDRHPNFLINHGAHPTCEVWIGGKGVLFKVRFGPYNHAVVLTNLEEWDINQVADLDDMTNLMKGQTVGVIGEIGYYKNTDWQGNPLTDNRGNAQTHVFMDATAILNLDGSVDFSTSGATEPESTASESEPATEAPAPTWEAAPAPDKTADAFTILKARVRAAIKQIGPQATFDDIRQSHITEKDFPDITENNIKMCIELVKKEIAAQDAGDPSIGSKVVKALAGQITDLVDKREWVEASAIITHFHGKSVAGSEITAEIVHAAIAYASEQLWIQRDTGHGASVAYEPVS